MIAILFGATALAGTWNLDPAHTKVGFRVSHMMVSSVEGSFPGVTGSMDFEPGRLEDAVVTVKVDMSTVDTANADRDAHLKAPEFLDVAKYPTMTFVSTGLDVKRNGSFELAGDLTIKGVTKPVVLQGSGLAQVVKDPWGNERVGASATTTIDRQDFGVSWNQNLDAGGVLVGDELQLRIDVEFTRAVAQQN